MALKGKNQTIVSNKKAKFEYSFVEQFTAGIVLTGTEVKSLRAGKASIQEAYCTIDGDEVFIRSMTINEYSQGSYNNHDPNRTRKLLLKKKEIEKIRKRLDEKGLTLVPVKIYFNERNFVKVDIALAKGKNLYDKRSDIKEKDTKRELDRMMKNY